MIDSNIIVSYLVESDLFHEKAVPYINGLENGDYTFHASMLVPVEVVGVISRKDPLPNRLAILVRWQRTISDWERDGKIVLYPLDRDRMTNAINVTQRHRLRGSDSVVASLAEDLDMPLKTFDIEILARFQRASV